MAICRALFQNLCCGVSMAGPKYALRRKVVDLLPEQLIYLGEFELENDDDLPPGTYISDTDLEGDIGTLGAITTPTADESEELRLKRINYTDRRRVDRWIVRAGGFVDFFTGPRFEVQSQGGKFRQLTETADDNDCGDTPSIIQAAAKFFAASFALADMKVINRNADDLSDEDKYYQRALDILEKIREGDLPVDLDDLDDDTTFVAVGRLKTHTRKKRFTDALFERYLR